MLQLSLFIHRTKYSIKHLLEYLNSLKNNKDTQSTINIYIKWKKNPQNVKKASKKIPSKKDGE